MVASIIRAAAALSPLIAAMTAASPALAGCTTLDPAHPAVPDQARPVTAEDLSSLRDIGSGDSSDPTAASPLSLAPDGTRLAFILTRPDAETNTICRGLFVLNLKRPGPPRLIDSGGETILQEGGYRGLLVVTGMPATVRPQWAPDGRSLAYLRRDRGTTQIWIADTTGSGVRPMTSGARDVMRFAWSRNGGTIVYARRQSADARHRGLSAEARSGYHYDERFVPTRGFGPQPPANSVEETISLGVDSGEERPATSEEAAALAAIDDAPVGLAADPKLPLLPVRPRIEDAGGARQVCRAEICSEAVAAFADEHAESVLFLRREGRARGSLSLYRWTLGDGAVKRLWSTDQTLLGCVRASERLLCLSESARSPSRLAAIDIETGAGRTLFDPNPEFGRIELPKVDRIYWRNNRGLEARGDLVTPTGRRPDAGWPLVVVQYNSDGFLRGGTGDEYPIFALAARGIAVLSLDQPPPVAVLAPTLPDWEAVNDFNARGWAERRSLLSSLEIGVRMAVERGVADPAKIGLTGLSDGATTVAFALINAGPFAAASISSCCIEPEATMILGGPGWARQMRDRGFPAAGTGDRIFWAPMSLAQNASKIATPLLMQLSDDEHLLGLPTYEAFRQHGRSVDLYVFENEHHVKWQPAHRLAIYHRNLDWFDFWLRGVEDPDPDRSEQYARWRALRPTR
jgi:dipeptidyl aminopeptidase/acylaminoacyl peptidase